MSSRTVWSSQGARHPRSTQRGLHAEELEGLHGKGHGTPSLEDRLMSTSRRGGDVASDASQVVFVDRL
jgi:hypothetical protein